MFLGSNSPEAEELGRSRTVPHLKMSEGASEWNGDEDLHGDIRFYDGKQNHHTGDLTQQT
jgi:hypothetical protein